MAKKQNKTYDQCTPLRLTELQDSELKAAAAEHGITVNQYVRDSLVENNTISEGPEPKARKGYGKKNVA